MNFAKTTVSRKVSFVSCGDLLEVAEHRDINKIRLKLPQNAAITDRGLLNQRHSDTEITKKKKHKRKHTHTHEKKTHKKTQEFDILNHFLHAENYQILSIFFQRKLKKSKRQSVQVRRFTFQ